MGDHNFGQAVSGPMWTYDNGEPSVIDNPFRRELARAPMASIRDRDLSQNQERSVRLDRGNTSTAKARPGPSSRPNDIRSEMLKADVNAQSQISAARQRNEPRQVPSQTGTTHPPKKSQSQQDRGDRVDALTVFPPFSEPTTDSLNQGPRQVDGNANNVAALRPRNPDPIQRTPTPWPGASEDALPQERSRPSLPKPPVTTRPMPKKGQNSSSEVRTSAPEPVSFRPPSSINLPPGIPPSLCPGGGGSSERDWTGPLTPVTEVSVEDLPLPTSVTGRVAVGTQSQSRLREEQTPLALPMRPAPTPLNVPVVPDPTRKERLVPERKAPSREEKTVAVSSAPNTNAPKAVPPLGPTRPRDHANESRKAPQSGARSRAGRESEPGYDDHNESFIRDAPHPQPQRSSGMLPGGSSSTSIAPRADRLTSKPSRSEEDPLDETTATLSAAAQQWLEDDERSSRRPEVRQPRRSPPGRVKATLTAITIPCDETPATTPEIETRTLPRTQSNGGSAPGEFFPPWAVGSQALSEGARSILR
ncbi:hypothetical protein BDV25DRAFT_136648 [Aspergillus avenaceus]|uniref:Uncharacterized protein n=1 Tax=Aspergillus avenaceus TaxID=36643 RepID=A0A5N6U5M2_ASPAV|nr:hypothetical protein BDV25DRAFT_136648 [Aspergillus avenaceus]